MLMLSIFAALAATASAVDITVDDNAPLNYAEAWGQGENPGDGTLDTDVADPNWCDDSYPNQSPIDVKDDDLTPSYQVKPLHLIPHTVAETKVVLTPNGVELEMEGEWFTLEFEGEIYKASQLHFHSPSEHVFNGLYCDGEMHVVGSNVDEKKATGNSRESHVVLAFCMQMGINPNPFYTKLGDLFKSLPNGTATVVPGWESEPLLGWNFDSFMPAAQKDFIHYVGSYTTPSCNPNIEWIVFQEPVQVPVQFIEFMQRRFPQPANHRPLQPIGDRVLDYHHICDCNSVVAKPEYKPHMGVSLLFGRSVPDENTKFAMCRKACE